MQSTQSPKQKHKMQKHQERNNTKAHKRIIIKQKRNNPKTQTQKHKKQNAKTQSAKGQNTKHITKPAKTQIAKRKNTNTQKRKKQFYNERLHKHTKNTKRKAQNT